MGAKKKVHKLHKLNLNIRYLIDTNDFTIFFKDKVK